MCISIGKPIQLIQQENPNFNSLLDLKKGKPLLLNSVSFCFKKSRMSGEINIVSGYL